MDNILIISKRSTHPTNAGNSSWILSMVKKFKELGYNLHFLYITEKPIHNVYSESQITCIREMEDFYGKDNLHVYSSGWINKFISTSLRIFSLKFRNGFISPDAFYPYGLESAVKKLDDIYHYKICIINYYYLSKLFTYCKFPLMAIATHDCLAYKQLKVKAPTISLTASAEAKAMQRCQNIFALQDAEKEYFQIIAPNSRVYCLFNNVQYKRSRVVNGHKLLFLSGDNQYNINGIIWFLRHIFNKLKQVYPDTEIIIGGAICKMIPKELLFSGVILKGYIEDIDWFYDQADIVINPVYQGTGLKIKTLEAISYDKIVIVRSHSTEGFYDLKNAPMIVTDVAEEWISYITKIFSNVIDICEIKSNNEKYLDSLNDYVNKEYNRFINS